MNKITRTGSLVLSLTLALGLFSGCGSAEPGSTPGPDRVYVPQYITRIKLCFRKTGHIRQ